MVTISIINHKLLVLCHTDEFENEKDELLYKDGSVARYGPRTSRQRNWPSEPFNRSDLWYTSIFVV